MSELSLASPELDSRPEHRRESRISYRMNFAMHDVELWSSNVSKNGAQLCCPAMRYSSLADVQVQNMLVRWTVPTTNVVITAAAEVRYANACDDEVLIGLEFVSFENDSKAAWNDFIDRLAKERGELPN